MKSLDLDPNRRKKVNIDKKERFSEMLKEYLMQNNYFRKNELDKKIEKKSMV